MQLYRPHPAKRLQIVYGELVYNAALIGIAGRVKAFGLHQMQEKGVRGSLDVQEVSRVMQHALHVKVIERHMGQVFEHLARA